MDYLSIVCPTLCLSLLIVGNRQTVVCLSMNTLLYLEFLEQLDVSMILHLKDESIT